MEEGTKINRNCPGHMTKMAAAEPINKAKPFNILFQNQTSYNLNIWHGPSGTHNLHILHIDKHAPASLSLCVLFALKVFTSQGTLSLCGW